MVSPIQNPAGGRTPRFRERPASLRVTEEYMRIYLHACERGPRHDVEWFLRYFPEHWGCHYDGKTGLMYAAERGKDDIMQLLLEKDTAYARFANVNAVDNHGNTALLCAAEAGHAQAVKLLLDNNANPLACENVGLSALHFAAMYGRTEALQLLLPVCLPVIDKPDNDGSTPLSLAAANGHKAGVRLLLDYGAQLGPMADGQTAAYYARRRGYDDIADMLDAEPARREAAISAAIEGGIEGGLKLGKAFTLVKKKEPEKKPDKKIGLPSRAGISLSPSVAPQLLTPALKRNLP